MSRIFSNLGVGRRLAAGFALVGALLVAFGVVRLWSGRQISRLADTVAA